MNCLHCASPLKPGARFCSQCGARAEILSPFAEPTFLSLGHPLGVGEADGAIVYLVDRGDAVVPVAQESVVCWSNPAEADPAALAPLRQNGCVLDLSDPADFRTLLACTASRQGIGSVYKGKYSINLAMHPTLVTQIQLSLWRQADGVRTVEALFSASGTDGETFFDALRSLVQADLLYVRRRG